jgi:hypothetical protein
MTAARAVSAATKWSSIRRGPTRPDVFLAKGEQYLPAATDGFIKGSRLLWRRRGQRSDPTSHGCTDQVLAGQGKVKPARLGGSGGQPAYQHAATTDKFVPGAYSTSSYIICKDGKTQLKSSGDYSVVGFNSQSKNPGFLLAAAVNQGGDGTAAPVYTEYVPHRYVIYWFFYDYNGWDGAGLTERHQGDWEHIVVALDEHNRMKEGPSALQEVTAPRVAYAAHYCNLTYSPQTTLAASGDTAGGATHPVVYSALGGHASYATPGTQTFACGINFPLKKNQLYDKTSKGREWKTWQHPRNARRQPWYGFGGAWGEQGSKDDQPQTSRPCLCNSGPDGPSQGKLAKALPADLR